MSLDVVTDEMLPAGAQSCGIGKACAADIKQNCTGIKPGSGRIEACMKSHLAGVSEPCKEEMSQAAPAGAEVSIGNRRKAI